MKTADVFHYVNAKIPEISLGSSDQNIRDHLGQPKFSDSFIFDKQVHHCRTSPHLCSEFGKEYKLVRARLLLVINTILGHYAHFWIFGGNFSWLAKRGSRLVARGSRLGLAGSQNSLPLKTLVIFRTLFAQVSADSIRTHACSRIKYIVFYYSEQLIANVTPCFLQAVQFSFGLLCMVRGFARS